MYVRIWHFYGTFWSKRLILFITKSFWCNNISKFKFILSKKSFLNRFIVNEISCGLKWIREPCFFFERIHWMRNSAHSVGRFSYRNSAVQHLSTPHHKTPDSQFCSIHAQTYAIDAVIQSFSYEFSSWADATSFVICILRGVLIFF